MAKAQLEKHWVVIERFLVLRFTELERRRCVHEENRNTYENNQPNNLFINFSRIRNSGWNE